MRWRLRSEILSLLKDRLHRRPEMDSVREMAKETDLVWEMAKEMEMELVKKLEWLQMLTSFVRKCCLRRHRQRRCMNMKWREKDRCLNTTLDQ